MQRFVPKKLYLSSSRGRFVTESYHFPNCMTLHFGGRSYYMNEPHVRQAQAPSAGTDEVKFQDHLHNAAPPVRMEPTSNPTHQVGYSGPSARADPLPGCLPRPRSLMCASPCLPCPRSNICLLAPPTTTFPPPLILIPLPSPGLWLDGHNAGRNQLIR